MMAQHTFTHEERDESLRPVSRLPHLYFGLQHARIKRGSDCDAVVTFRDARVTEFSSVRAIKKPLTTNECDGLCS
jgi:hypothetical protein